MNTIKKLVAISATLSLVLWLVPIMPVAHATTIADGDLVKTADSGGVYYIQGSYKRVFPHANVYLSWGYPSDFSTVKTVSASELAAYTDANSMPFRDGSLFRGMGEGLYEYAAEAVYYVEGAKIRPVYSGDVYQSLFADSDWSKVTWVPDDLLSKFSYDVGDMLQETSTHPDGSLVTYAGDNQIYLLEDGNKRAVSDAAFSANQYNESNVIEIDAGESYADGSAVTGVESGLLTPGWSGISETSALTASLYNSPSAATIPDMATNVSVLRFNLTAGSSAASVTGLTFKRTGLGAYDDWNVLYIYEGSTNITPSGRSLSSDDHEVEFAALSIDVAANSSKTLELRGDIKTAGVDAATAHAFQLISTTTSATVAGLPLTGNTMTIGSVDVSEVTLADGAAPVNPSVGAQGAEVANFTVAAGDNDVSVNQVVFTYTGTMTRSDITNINLYLLGESDSLASVSVIDSNDTFTMTLASPFVISQGYTKTFLLKADLAGEVAQTLKMYIDETYHFAADDNEYGYGAAITNGFDTGDAATLTLQGGEVTLADNGPIADSVAKNQQDVVLTKIGLTSERDVEVRKLFVTVTDLDFDNPSDGLSDLKIKDADTGATLMTYSSSFPTVANETADVDYLMTGTFNLSANTTRNLAITCDVGIDAGDLSNDKILNADLKMVDRGDDSVATGAADEESQIRDILTGDWVLTTDITPLTVSGNNQTIEDASLAIAVSSTPVSGLTVVKGATDVDGVGVVFTSGDASTANLRQMQARVYVNSASTFLKANEDTSPNGEITSIMLYDGATKLSEKTITSTSSSGHDYGLVTFDNLDVDVAAGGNKKLTMKFDVADSAGAVYVAVGVLGANITAYDADGNTLTVSENVNAYVGTDDSVVPTNYTIVATSGALTMAQDASTPDSAILLAGTSNVEVAKIAFTATDEAWTIDKLRVEIDTSGNESSVEAVDIAFPGGSASGFLTSGYVNFTDLNWLVEADTEELLTISVDLAEIDANIDTTGRTIKMGVVWNAGFEANGESMTQKTTIAAADTHGNSFYLRKSVPTLTAGSPATVLTSGEKVVSEFTVAADAAGAITVKKFSWDVIAGDIDAGGELSATSWKLYDTSNPSTAITSHWSDGTSTSASGAIAITATKVLIAELGSEKEIGAGSSKTFQLKATFSGVEENDSYIVNLLNDDNDTAVATGGLVDSDLAGVLIDVTSVDFLWSDKAKGVNHADSYQSVYDDWTNGYLVNTFPVNNTMSQ